MSVLLFGLALFAGQVQAQTVSLSLNKDWQFRKAGDSTWYRAEVPGTVHTDLLANHLVPDPYYRDNEEKVQWVEKEDWEYRTSFSVTPALLKKKYIELVFDGLDTHADVYLNDKKVLQADNMFRQWRIPVASALKMGSNHLGVHFYSSARIAKERKAAEKVPYPDNERIYVRKAQYQFGWDWGPRLVTSGIWREVRLAATDSPMVTEPDRPRMPRKVKLVTERDSIGEAFYFTVDGKRTFIKGANWIPADNFVPRAKKLARYEQLLRAAKEANINMIRVWGGGLYEEDIFYDLCDRYGIMVWQDFMFAGALYPGDPAFLENVAEEVRYQVKRLRHHPSIVLWCGNNEIEEAWHNWGWQKQLGYSAADSARLWNDYRKLFHQIIPGILKELDPERPYWPSSPSLGWGRDSAYRKGDVHYWGVWWGREPVEKYREKVGRFMSEYGMEGMPHMKTMAQFSLPSDWDTSSATMRVHQKHPYGYQNIKYYIERKFRTPRSFEDLVYVSQLMQADAISTAIEAHRGNIPITMGTLLWQWNDCWPVTSWSTLDYYGRKKALFYEVKRDFEKVVVFPLLEADQYKVKVVSELPKPLTFSLEVDFIDLEKGIQKTKVVVRNARTDTNGTFLVRYKREPSLEDSSKRVLSFRVTSGGKTVAQNLLHLTEPKNLNLPKPTLKWKVSGTNTLQVSSDKFAYGVQVNAPDGVQLADNYFHLMPGEKKSIRFSATLPAETILKNITLKSLVDTY